MSESQENTLTSYLGPEFQQRLMWQVLVEPDFAEKILSVLSVEYFDDPNMRRLLLIILAYVNEYGKVPNLQNQSVLQAINEFKTPNNVIEEESLFSVIKRIEMWNERVLNQGMLNDGDVVQKTIYTFIKQQEYRKLAEGIIHKVKTGEMKKKETIGEIEEKFQKISIIGNTEDKGTDVTENIEKALRKSFRETIATGIDVIDEVTGGGLGKGEFGLILTPSGVGKTTLLTKIANTARGLGKNVLQIIFEDTVEQIQRKHFTIWTEIGLSQIDDNNELVIEKTNLKISKLPPGKLTIKRFSQEDTTMKDIRSFISREQKMGNFKYDMVVLDYLDCLESHKRTADRNEAELVIVKSFESMAGDLNIPCWSAIQSNRSGFDAELVEAYQAGGNIKRVQKAHFFMSVAKTPDQKEASLASIRIIKARFAHDGQTFKDCIFNNDTMQIIIKDDRYVGKRYNTLKKYGDEDIEKLETKTSHLLHSSISSKLEDEVLNDMANAYIAQNKIVIPLTETNTVITPHIEVPTETPPIKNMHISTTRTDLDQTEIKTIVNIATEAVTKTEDNSDLLDFTEDKNTEAIIINEGLSDAVNDAVKPDLLDFSGDTTTETVTETEVTIGDVRPDVKPKVDLTPYIPPRVRVAESPPQLNETKNLSLDEIEKSFVSPDAPQANKKHIFDMLRKMAENQEVVQRE